MRKESVMKKSIYLIIAFVVTITSCDTVDKLLTFKIKNEAEIVIPSTVGINTPISIPTPDVQTNSQQSFENNNTKKDLVKNVKLTSLVLQILEPEGQTFSFLKKITIYISAEGLPEKKLAYLDDIPVDAGKEITLIPTQENFDEYIKKDAFSIRTEAVTDKAFIHDIRINAKMEFTVTADIL